MIVLMKMKKTTLKYLLKLLLIPNENGLEIPVIALKIIFLDLKICDLLSRLKSSLLLKIDCFLFHYYHLLSSLLAPLLETSLLVKITSTI
jgi:hypothetical protein